MTNRIKAIMLAAVFIGGFASLSAELIVMRQLSTFVGSTAVTAAIIIGIIMLFMSVGYYHGSTASLSKIKLRQRICRSFMQLGTLVVISSSFVLLTGYFILFYEVGLNGIVLRTFVYCLLFLSFSAYLFGDITSLLSRYLHKYNRNYTGKIMAVDTIGSVLGSILSTLVLMPLIGVNYTIVFVVVLCVTGAVLFSKKHFRFGWIALPAAAVILNHSLVLEKIFGIVENNAVSTIAILNVDKGKSKLMVLNDTFASKISQDKKLMFGYTTYIEDYFLKTLPEDKKHKILVLGAGGFTMGMDDDFNEYTYVDIDASLKEHAEKEFLGRPLGKNKKFVVNDANQFLNETNELYDVIILDSYSSATPPLDLVTREYFIRVKKHSAPGGLVAANVTARPDFSDAYSTTIDNTLRSVFTENLRSQIIQPFNPWPKDKEEVNVLYVWYNRPNPHKVYTINKNTLFWDK